MIQQGTRVRAFQAGLARSNGEGIPRGVLFTTSIDTPDNVLTSVGNAKIFGGTIKNFSHDPAAVLI